MPRRQPTPKAGRARAARASAVPTPMRSTATTPLASAHASAYASEVDQDKDGEVEKIPIGALTLDEVPLIPFNKKIKSPPKKPFPFMDLPSELRLKIYGFFFADVTEVIDLDPDNHKRIHGKLRILRVCRAMYQEGSFFFYSTRTFRIFPTHWGRFFKTKRPLLARLTPKQRECITSLELRVGPGWSKPPRGWVVNEALGLADCVNARQLNVLVECDPSDGIFQGFRRSDTFYEVFCRSLLDSILLEAPSLSHISFDAFPSVKKSGPMMKSLVEMTLSHSKTVCWGPLRGWTDMDEEEEINTTTAAHLLQSGLNVLVVA